MATRFCRVWILKSDGQRVGCGFVIDAHRVVTCLHVIRMLNDNGSPAPALGDFVSILHEDRSEPIMMTLAAKSPSGIDACVLRRVAGAFQPDESVLWVEGRSGMEYSGLGMSADYREVGLKGELVVLGAGGRIWRATAVTHDGRIEPGSSGAGVFDAGGALVGMVATFQQEQSGGIIPAELIDQEFGLKRFDPAPSEPFPSLTLAPVPFVAPAVAARLPVSDIIRNVDRTQQRDRINLHLDKLKSPGFLIVEMPATAPDLPHACAEALRSRAFDSIMRKLAGDGFKEPPRAILAIDDIFESEDPGALLRFRLQEQLDADDATPQALRRAYCRETAPLAIVVPLDAAQLDRLPPGVSVEWARLLDEVSSPRLGKPLILFVCLTSHDGAREGFVPTDPAARWALRLPPLSTIKAEEVTRWCRRAYNDPALSARIEGIVAARAIGEFRMGELQAWLEAGG